MYYVWKRYTNSIMVWESIIISYPKDLYRLFSTAQITGTFDFLFFFSQQRNWTLFPPPLATDLVAKAPA